MTFAFTQIVTLSQVPGTFTYATCSGHHFLGRAVFSTLVSMAVMYSYLSMACVRPEHSKLEEGGAKRGRKPKVEPPTDT